MKVWLFAAWLAFTLLAGNARADFAGWKHSGSLYLLTTPDGANLPAGAVVERFPALVRLHRDFFDFTQAHPHGNDLRFATADGATLPYQIETWDAAGGFAEVWVLVPRIEGNARQELKVFWGRPDAPAVSDGRAVFSPENGYFAVWHLNGDVREEVGSLVSQDVGTNATVGVIGAGRKLAGKQGVFGGEKIENLPTGVQPHSTSAWLRAASPNATILAWGNEPGGRGSKVRMQLRSPPHIHIDSNFSDVIGEAPTPLGEWLHVVHTYGDNEGRVYLNGVLCGAAKPTLNIQSPARLWLGGWYHNYDFVGDLDEVRISKVARSPEWVRLEYENQKPQQTLVGPLVAAGSELSVSSPNVVVEEGRTAIVNAKVGGAEKLYWIVKRDGRETVVAVDRTSYEISAGRTVGDASLTLQLRAIYADGAKTKDVAVSIRERVPEPEFSLAAPPEWDGRTPVELVPQIANLAAMQAAGAGELNYQWNLAPIAVMDETAPGKLILKRAQNSGLLTVSASIDNGGAATTRSAVIRVTEPTRDVWVARTPDADEQPEENQFYPRDDKNEGTLFYNGTLTEPADAVFLKLYADDKLVETREQRVGEDCKYALSLKLKPGLIKYKIEFGSRQGERETIVRMVGNLVCGDAYIINGQSNAVATDFGKEDPTFRSEWIRSFGSTSGQLDLQVRWGEAAHRSRDRERYQIGYWGMELGRRLVEEQGVPVCFINGAVGGTRIDQHQRNPADPLDPSTIYGRLLQRVRAARLTHGVRAVIWHQGENDQGADGPSGGFGWETYRALFIELAGAWKEDYPNIQRYYVFQIWPRSCSMGVGNSDDRLREVQRTLPTAFSNLSVTATLGIDPPGGCHYPAAGYAEFAKLISPLIQRDLYKVRFNEPINSANLVRAAYSPDRTRVVLTFDQPVVWQPELTSQFSLDGVKNLVAAGSVNGSELTLTLKEPSEAKTISYLEGRSWSQANLLRGTNGLAALTFCEVAIEPAK